MPAPRMRARVDAAIKAADHLNDKDTAAVQLLRALADAIDSAYKEDPDSAAYKKYLGWCAPNVVNVMKSLGLTADSGPKAGFVAPEKPNALTELRARRFQRHAQGGGDVG